MLRRKWTNAKAARRQAEIYDRLWRNFRTYPTAEDGRHDRGAWLEMPGLFCACVIKIPGDVLNPEFAPLRDSLASEDGVRLHPDTFLHLMLQELGPVVDGTESRYEITPERLDEFAAAAQTELEGAPAFWLHLGGANAFRDSVVLEARDRGQTDRLHRRLHELAALPVRSSYAFLPHVTIAHLTPDASTRKLVDLIDSDRRTNFGAMYVDHVDLVTLEAREEYPDLDVRATIQLAG